MVEEKHVKSLRLLSKDGALTEGVQSRAGVPTPTGLRFMTQDIQSSGLEPSP